MTVKKNPTIKVTTQTPVPDLEGVGEWHKCKQAVLDCYTIKSKMGGIYSVALIEFHDDSGAVQSYGDFYKEMRRASDKRATQKNIDAQHAEVFTTEIVQLLICEARCHYTERANTKARGGTTYPQAAR